MKIRYIEFRPWLNASLVRGQIGDFDDFTNSTALSEQLILDKVHQHVSAYQEDHHHHPPTIDHFHSDYSEPKYYLGKYDCTVYTIIVINIAYCICIAINSIIMLVNWIDFEHADYCIGSTEYYACLLTCCTEIMHLCSI